MGNMGSGHPLVEVNVSFKFEGNPSISKGVIERTRIGDGPTDRRIDGPTRQSESSIAPPTFCGGGIINRALIFAGSISNTSNYRQRFRLANVLRITQKIKKINKGQNLI